MRGDGASLTRDGQYVQIVVDAIRVSKNYRPKFGHGVGLSLSEFQALYGTDPFYSWFGLESPLMYAAHKAAGGMTSIYRQIGIGCQRLIKRILMDTFALTEEQVTWSYRVQRRGGGQGTLSLDSKIPIAAVTRERRKPLNEWLEEACREAGVSGEVRRVLNGPVFEVRQGYKSKDSKRQNADIANAGAAYADGYLPVLFLLSLQIDDDVADRYKAARWLILYGATTGSRTRSTYEFCRRVIQYDLEDFFRRHSRTFKREIESILKALLT